MSRRIAFAVLAAGLLATVAPAGAAPGPDCVARRADPGIPPALDILCVDLTVGCTTVSGRMRLVTTDTGSHPLTMVAGARWSLAFQVTGVDYAFSLTRSATGPDQASFNAAGEVGPAPTVRVDATTITWTVPRSAVVPLKKPEMIVTNVVGISYLLGGNADTEAGRVHRAPCRRPA